MRARSILLGCVAILSTAGPARPAEGPAARPPALTAVVLGAKEPDAAVGRPLPDGGYVLTGAGRDVPDNADRGSFAGLETDAPDFTFVARIAGAPEGAPAQYGLAVRAGLAGTEKAVALRYDGREGRRRLGWLMRYHVTPSTHDGSNRSYHKGEEPQPSAGRGVWLKVVRRYPFVSLHASDDGDSWREVGADHRLVLLPQKVWVGLQVTGGGDGKTPVAVTFDRVAFRVDPAGPATETRASLAEYHPRVGPYRLFVAKAEAPGKRGPDRFFSPLLLMPTGMDPAKIRAILYSAGSKEVTVGGRQLPWVKGEGGLRRPAALADWEGALDLDDVDPFNQILERAGVVRVGGYFGPEHYGEAVRQLSRVSGIAHLPDVPFVVTGASFAGGYSARAAQFYPEKTVAAAPVIIGPAGAETDDPRVLATPHLHVIGSRDGGHLGQVQKAIPTLRDRHALWAAAPMWRVYHRQHKSNALILPFFLDVLRQRLPADADPTKGPVRLTALREADGWLGLADTWETNAAQVVPFREYRGDSKNLVWLPSEPVARAWQAFVSENPQTVIHFPSFEGHDAFGQPPPHGWHNSFLEAGRPFELVASGPRGPGVEVEYRTATRKLRVVKGGEYRVTLEGLEPGLHVLYAITTLGGRQEISRPVTILFQARPKAG